MSTFTVFFCGTGSNSLDYDSANYSEGQLISTLARNHLGVEFDDWLIADGPGSGNQQENDKWTVPGNYTDARGTTFGSGWEENVKHAIAVIKKDPSHMRALMTDAEIRILQREKAAAEAAGLEPQNTFGGWTPANKHRKIVPQALQKARAKVLRTPLPDRVNLIGWSRGAVTCHMMANAMYADPQLRHICVNIFAIDPVPGPLNFQLNRTTLNTNVLEYRAVYARDERARGFTPIIPDVKVKKELILMPGAHATLVGNASKNGKGGGNQIFPEPGQMVRHLAETFLRDNGTQLGSCLNLKDTGLLELYEQILKDDRSYIAMRQLGYGMGCVETESGDRWAAVGSGAVVAGLTSLPMLHPDPIFVNWHHRSVYIKHYADLTGRPEAIERDLLAQWFPVTTGRFISRP
ncbi:hypothetical protein ABQ039_013950 [Xanthomonas sp. WHRI 6108]|uniref:hypothetical protein n=1 Tax=Xanthomonas TaxID=338 RepID=UPI00161D4A67|nr:hypothetical protein [Xanthomonas arboricola]MBB5673330.1 hypothetical protein [Xanthomonas arboricola]